MPSDRVPMTLDRQELVLLVNALNEAREAVEDWEFQTRLGGTVEEAQRLQDKLRLALRDGD